MCIRLMKYKNIHENCVCAIRKRNLLSLQWQRWSRCSLDCHRCFSDVSKNPKRIPFSCTWNRSRNGCATNVSLACWITCFGHMRFATNVARNGYATNVWITHLHHTLDCYTYQLRLKHAFDFKPPDLLNHKTEKKKGGRRHGVSP